MANRSRSIDDRDDGDYELPDELDRPPLVRAVRARWKHAALAIVVGATAYILYQVGGGWTLDATVFALTALGIVAYSLLTFRGDLA